jgi:hypothetical protein
MGVAIAPTDHQLLGTLNGSEDPLVVLARGVLDRSLKMETDLVGVHGGK